jgi:hypothetical protein
MLTRSRCSIEGCDRPSRARGMCELHYGRVKRGRDPLDPGQSRNRIYSRRPDRACETCGVIFTPADGQQVFCTRRCANARPESGRQRSTEADFWAKVGGPDENGCRIWQGAPMAGGYGQFVSGRKVKRAHQWSFYFAHGHWAEGWVLHRCGVKLCVNPDHLYDGTPQDNALDRARLGEDFNARKTHCVNGHPFDEENTGRSTSGQRVCRACARERASRYSQRPEVKERNRRKAKARWAKTKAARAPSEVT